MNRLAVKEDIPDLTEMLYMMYLELEPSHTLTDPSVFIGEVIRCMNDPKQQVFIDTKLKGFFMVVDETEAMTPTLKLYNGTRVYVKPEYRSGRVLAEFYDTIFREYPDGDILGVTNIKSKHIAVLEKRHTRIANVYKLKRS